MKPARERQGQPDCTASAKLPSSVRVGIPMRQKASTDTGTKGRVVDHLPINVPLGGVPGSNQKPGGARNDPSKGGSRRVDDGNITHHKPARDHEHDIPRREGGHQEGPVSGRGPKGQERGPDRPAAPERPPGPAQGHQRGALGGQRHSLLRRRRARVQQKGRQGARKGWERSGRGAPPWCGHPP
jgi:hypothetical protein